MESRRGKRNYILLYLVLFSLTFFLVFLPFLLYGKSTVGMGDGESQYILHLRYTGRWLRDSFARLFSGRMPVRYDFTIGAGDDIGAVVRFHPLDLIAGLVPASGTEILYNILFFVRALLSGMSFSAFVLSFGAKPLPALAGSLVYVFSGFTFGLGIVHPTYMSHMIILPLLLLGAERQMKSQGREISPLFVLMTALGFISNYYFMYITSIALLFYCLIRFPMIIRENRRKRFFSLFFKVLFPYLLGLGLSAAFLLPALMRYLSSYRTGSYAARSSLLVYSDWRRYFAWFLNLITPYVASGNGTHLNFAVVVLFAMVRLFAGPGEKTDTSADTEALKKEQERKPVTAPRDGQGTESPAEQENMSHACVTSMKISILGVLICLLVPACGYVLAAMNNENNRWVYLIAAVCGVLVAFAGGDIFCRDRRYRKVLILVTGLFCAGTGAWCAAGGFSVYHVAAAAEAVILLAVICLAPARINRKNRSGVILLLATFISILISGYMTYGKQFGDLTRFYQDAGTTLTHYSDSDYTVYSSVTGGDNSRYEVWENGFFRVDGVWSGSQEDNASLYLAYPGMQVYNSVINADQIRTLRDTENPGLTTVLHIRSLDGRTAAEELAGVKYYAADDSNSSNVPCGYTKIPVSKSEKLSLYENQYPMSFGFTTGRIIEREDYEKLSPAARDQVLLKAALVENGDGGENAADSLKMTGELERTDGSDIEKEILKEDASVPSAGGKIQPAGGKESAWQTTGGKGSLNYSWETKPGYECYVRLQGLRNLSARSSYFSATVSSEGIRRGITLCSDSYPYTHGGDNYLVRLGYEDGREPSLRTLKLTIPSGETVSLGQVTFVYVPMKDYQDNVSELDQYHLEDTAFSANEITGHVSLPESRMMVFQIPYGSGWRAEVNGQKAELVKADGCWMGLLLPEGESNIKLSYRTPGLSAGEIISVLSLAAVILALLLQVRRKRQA